ncbi:MAG: septum formation initiator family protein [Patescibacteria group bacterium]|nr:septum formation initiator family protein [Patescibacteria group bacterium]
MSKKYNLSPTDRLNYVHKGKVDPGSKFSFVKKFFSTFFLLFILVLILIPYYNRLSRKKIIEDEIKKEKENISLYEKDNEELQGLISYLSSDQAAEENARVNFGLQKEGETVVVVKIPSKSETEESNVGNENETRTSCFRKWYNYFFKK